MRNDDLRNVAGDDLNLIETGQAMYSDLQAGRIDVEVDTYPSVLDSLAGGGS